MAPTIFRRGAFAMKQVKICKFSNKYNVYFVVLITNGEYFSLKSHLGTMNMKQLGPFLLSPFGWLTL